MLTIPNEILTEILHDFNIHSEIVSISELQRSHYEENDPASKEVRLIVKAELESGNSVVVRFKNEPDVSLEIVKAQSEFAKLLAVRVSNNGNMREPSDISVKGRVEIFRRRAGGRMRGRDAAGKYDPTLTGKKRSRMGVGSMNRSVHRTLIT